MSGNAVTGQAAGISGRVSADGGTQAVIAGTISETGGGQYQANLYTSDTSGNNLGFLFTASGCVPIGYSVVTQQNVSGRIYAASGVNATVPITSVSGINAVVPTASLSGVNSIVPPANLSGVFASVPISTISGTNAVVPIASISGVNSVATVTSGSTYLASGSIFRNTFASGVVGGGSGNLPSAWGGSGAVTVGQNLDKSGYTAGSISGTVFPASGAFVTVPIASISGTNVVVPIASISGVNSVASVASGTVFLASGQTVQVQSGIFVTVPPATLSGVNAIVPPANLSGVFSTVPISTISGTNAVVPISSISGVNAVTTIASGSVFLASGQVVQAASGAFVTVPITSISGVNTVVPPASLSGVFSTVPIASLSGVNAVTTISSGTVFLASGQSVQIASGASVIASLYSGAGPVSLSAADSPVLQTGTALSGGTSTITLQTALGTDNLPLGCVVKITGGTGAYQTRVITNYTNSTKIATVDNPWEVTPDATSVYTVVYDHLGRTTGNSFYAADLILWAGASPSPLIDGQVQIASGPFVTLPKATISGVNAIVASGNAYLASGQSVALNSGQMVALYSGQQTAVWSGTSVNVFSGTVSLTSGEVFVRIPQGVLTRDFTAYSGLVASGVSGRCVVNAGRKLINKWSLTVMSGYLTVYQEDDSTVAYTQALTVASGAAPITSMDTD